MYVWVMRKNFPFDIINHYYRSLKFNILRVCSVLGGKQYKLRTFKLWWLFIPLWHLIPEVFLSSGVLLLFINILCYCISLQNSYRDSLNPFPYLFVRNIMRYYVTTGGSLRQFLITSHSLNCTLRIHCHHISLSKSLQ